MTTGLLEQESTGGAVARVGFEYQDAFVLQHLPLWLSQSAFSHVVSEAIGDVEVCYFGAAGTLRRVMYEAKNHTLSAPEFWGEIARFKAVFDAAPTEFVRFTLVCRGYNTVTSPLLAKLDRLRGVGSSYQADSAVLSNGRREVVAWVVKKGYGADLAEFVLDYVDFVTYADENADSAFSGELEKHLTSDLNGKQASRLRDLCKSLISKSSFGPLHRKDAEAALCEALGDGGKQWLLTPIRVQLLPGPPAFHELGLEVGPFNGPSRGTIAGAAWRALSANAQELGDFIKASSLRRCIALDGKQRMSLSCLLGYAYGATRGFVLHIEHNSLVYRTDVHAAAVGPFFAEAVERDGDDSAEGVVCVGFPTPVGADNLSTASGTFLAGLPSLHLAGTRAIDSVEMLNLAVAETKAALVRFRSTRRLSRIHLFVKAPSVFAMALGHRLNGVCEVQLYDWVGAEYWPTALLDH